MGVLRFFCNFSQNKKRNSICMINLLARVNCDLYIPTKNFETQSENPVGKGGVLSKWPIRGK